ncbi:piggyBac transposable element-derived protein 2-like, partial [Aphis craccivora]
MTPAHCANAQSTFLTPPEGSEDELKDFNIDELVCENYDTDTYDHNDDNPILIVVPNSESLNLRQPLVNSTKTSEVSVVHTPTVDKINTTKRTKFREIKSVVWKKRPFQISPGEIKFK